MNIIVKILIMELSKNCVKVQVHVVATKMLVRKLNENIRSGHWPDIHKTNGIIVSVSLIVCNFICQT